jgi:hypothetical protein
MGQACMVTGSCATSVDASCWRVAQCLAGSARVRGARVSPIGGGRTGGSGHEDAAAPVGIFRWRLLFRRRRCLDDDCVQAVPAR